MGTFITPKSNKCPLCGSYAYIGFNKVECIYIFCKNFSVAFTSSWITDFIKLNPNYSGLNWYYEVLDGINKGIYNQYQTALYSIAKP